MIKALLSRLVRIVLPREKLLSLYCVRGRGCRLYKTARISNSRHERQRITIGDGSHIAGDLMVFMNQGEINIGENVFIGENTRVWAAGRITIGDFVQIGPNCNIFDSNVHSLNAMERRREFLEYCKLGRPTVVYDLRAKAVTIGQDAWVGAGVTILKGVNIGSRAIVGAGSIVTKDIPDGAKVSGNSTIFIRSPK